MSGTLAGALCLALCVFGLDSRLMAGRRAEVHRLTALVALFEAVRRGIDGYIPIGSVLSELGAEVYRPLGLSAPPTDLGRLCDGDPALSLLLTRAASTLGHGYREAQLALCDGYLSQLKALRAASESALNEQKGLVRPLLYLGMVALIVLFW